jgi:hypothetical protein
MRTAADDVVREVSLTGSAQVHFPATWVTVITPADSDILGGEVVVLHGPHGRPTTSALACRCLSGGTTSWPELARVRLSSRGPSPSRPVRSTA